MSPEVFSFFLSHSCFRCFKVNSYFVGTCKRKIRVEQVKSPKKTLFVFSLNFLLPKYFYFYPYSWYSSQACVQIYQTWNFDSFSQYFLLSAVINFSIALFFPVFQLVINDSFICGLLLFQLLFDTWVKAHRWYKMQPLDHIR